MFRISLLVFFIVLFVSMLSVPDQRVLAWQEPPSAEKAPANIPRVKRARRPVFDAQSSDGVFFKDVYAEGIVGDRPAVLTAKQAASQMASSGTSGGDAGAGGWSKIVDASAIEDEVKLLQRELSQLVTTPVMFQTKYNEVRERFEILSMLFAIIRQYDGDIRWSEYAPEAQILFQRAAISSRTGTAKGFQYCKSRLQDLQELVRGGSIATKEPIPETIKWEVASDRTPIMVRLESANEQLKSMTSSKAEFSANAEKLNQLGNLVAAMGEVITKDGMPEAEEDDYVAFGVQMKDAATQLKQAAKNDDFDGASKAANLVSQSCSDCHAEWR